MSFVTINAAAIVPKTANVVLGRTRTVARVVPASNVVRCEAANEDKVQMSRRGLVSLVAAAPALYAAKALALIDYDEDDEYVLLAIVFILGWGLTSSVGTLFLPMTWIPLLWSMGVEYGLPKVVEKCLPK